MNKLQLLPFVMAGVLAGCQETKEEAPSAKAVTLEAPDGVPVVAGAGNRLEVDEGRMQSLVELARKDVQLKKAAIIADNMVLTDAEAARFWPIHRDYEGALMKLNDRRIELIRRFLPAASELSDDDARALAEEAFDIEDARTALKREYFRKFQGAIPAAKAARFFQIENQVNMLIDLRVAGAMPLIR